MILVAIVSQSFGGFDDPLVCVLSICFKRTDKMSSESIFASMVALAPFTRHVEDFFIFFVGLDVRFPKLNQI